MASAYPSGVPEGFPNHPNLRSNFAPLPRLESRKLPSVLAAALPGGR